MTALNSVPDGLLTPVEMVVRSALGAVPDLSPDRIMLVGAQCRDVLHAWLGHSFSTTATRDLDLALGLSGWGTYDALTRAFRRGGNSGVRFEIAGQLVDLLPFGALEDPTGVVTPPTRPEPMSVWAFEEVHAASQPLNLTHTLTIRVPTVPGYAALKLAAWLDRSEWSEAKDAPDLALVAYWYAHSPAVTDRLYDTPGGLRILTSEGLDLERAALRLLGTDVTGVIGPARTVELIDRWPGDSATLIRNFRLPHGTQARSSERRRQELISALTRGLADPTPGAAR